ncbi:MAG: hypothetical protein WC967_13715 [Balneolaceae bacterium]
MNEFAIAIVAIVGGLGFATFLFWNFFNLIKMWINRKSGNSIPDNIDPKFLAALSKFKKDTERRITNLETIISDLETQSIQVHKTASNTHKIELESDANIPKQAQEDGSKLRNMLNE